MHRDSEAWRSEASWTWAWRFNVCCGCLIAFSDLLFMRGMKISDGRDKCCGCNLDEQTHQTGPEGTALCYDCCGTCTMSKCCAEMLQGCTAPWNQQEIFIFNLDETWITLELSVCVLRSTTSPLGLGELQQDTMHCLVRRLSLNHTARETAWAEGSLCYLMGGRFKSTVFSGTFWEAGVAKCSFKVIQFLLQNGVKSPY